MGTALPRAHARPVPGGQGGGQQEACRQQPPLNHVVVVPWSNPARATRICYALSICYDFR